MKTEIILLGIMVAVFLLIIYFARKSIKNSKGGG